MRRKVGFRHSLGRSRNQFHYRKLFGASDHRELAHHSGVFMLENVAMIHVGGLPVAVIWECHANFDDLARVCKDHVLEARFLWLRRFPVSADDVKLSRMDMHGM